MDPAHGAYRGWAGRARGPGAGGRPGAPGVWTSEREGVGGAVEPAREERNGAGSGYSPERDRGGAVHRWNARARAQDAVAFSAHFFGRLVGAAGGSREPSPRRRPVPSIFPRPRGAPAARVSLHGRNGRLRWAFRLRAAQKIVEAFRAEEAFRDQHQAHQRVIFSVWWPSPSTWAWARLRVLPAQRPRSV